MNQNEIVPLLEETTDTLVAMPRQALVLLRDMLLRESGPAAATFLQEAGYAGGQTVSAGFQTWLESKDYPPMSQLNMSAFSQAVSEYFSQLGWGTLNVSRLNDAVAALDTSDWWESDPAAGMDHPGCHLSTGLLADLLSRVSSQPLAVLEVECRSMGSRKCRFLTGSAEALERVYERMVRGSSYVEAVDTLVD